MHSTLEGWPAWHASNFIAITEKVKPRRKFNLFFGKNVQNGARIVKPNTGQLSGGILLLSDVRWSKMKHNNSTHIKEEEKWQSVLKVTHESGWQPYEISGDVAGHYSKNLQEVPGFAAGTENSEISVQFQLYSL